MSTNTGKQRKSRQTPNRRTRQFDKSLMNEGVYSNPRLVHSTLVLVGCNVQVTVKNGGIYEGIFKTVSPSSQIVLEMAHKVDASPAANQSTIPTKQMLINSIIFNLSDVVTITASNVDMEFANKDNFTDSAITKFNNGGGSVEKELQPWDADGGLEAPLESLEKAAPVTTTISSPANGWAAEDMFNINAEKFEVKSSYDPNLTQYTTPLVKQDTKEYREREARAARLANEIEGSDGYRDRIALENGDGDDEEMAFSAVVRPGEANNNSSTSGKYVPPHLRRTGPPPPATNRPPRITTSGNQSPHAQSPSPQQPSPSRAVPGPALTPHTTQQRAGQQVAAGPVVVSVSSAEAPSEETTDNKNKEDRRPSDLQERGKSSERNVPGHSAQTNTAENRKPPGKARDRIQDLYDFKSKFQLSDNKAKENPDRKPNQTSPVTSQAPGQPLAQAQQAGQQIPASQPSTEQPQPSLQSAPPPQTQQLGASPQVQANTDKPPPTTATASAAGTVDKKEDDKKDLDADDKDKKSILNPLAKEFVPGKFTVTRQPQPLQISTPPRAATQSPVIVPMPGPSLYHPYIVQNSPHGPNTMIQNSQSQRIAAHNTKRVVVSAQTRPDLAAAAATGQPLLQTPLNQNPQYPAVHQFNVQPTATMMAANAAQGALPQVFHQSQGIMPVGPGNPRMVNPQLVPGPTTPNEPVGFQQNQQHVFVSPQAHSLTNVPSYIGGPPTNAGAAGSNQQPPPSHSMPTHMAPHHHATPPHSQTTNHMSSQGGASGGHPTASPVPQPGSASHQHPPQGHPPPSSGTPQPPVMYHGVQGNPPQPGYPPLQPSPHTPTSPQTMYPQGVTFSVPYPVSQSYSVQPHLTYSTTGQPHTTVTHAPHHQHAHLPQMVMMAPQPHQNNPHPSAHNPGLSHQMQHNHAVAAAATGAAQQHNQYQMNHSAQHPQGHPVQSAQRHPVQGGPLHGQAGPGLSLNMVQHPQMVSQAPQPYHHNQ